MSGRLQLICNRRVSAGLCLALAVLAFAWAGLGHAIAAEPTFPTLTGRVVDAAGLLSADDKAAIATELARLEGKSTDQLVVVTLPSLEGYDIADYGYRLGRAWGIGQAGKNNGALLIVAPNERKVRIEVGRGLEPILTDLMTHVIIENAILPRFRKGDFPGGIRAGVRDVVATLLGDAEEVKQRALKENSFEDDIIPLLIIAFWIAIVIYIMWAQSRYVQQARSAGSQRRRGRGSDVIFVPGGSSGGWSGGGGWGSSSGGGGFSGGGGDFGGGGSSGSW